MRKTTNPIWLLIAIVISTMLVGCAPGSPPEEAMTDDLVEATKPPQATDTSVPTQVPSSPTTEPTSEPVAITSFEDLAGTWLRTLRGFDYKFEVDKQGGATMTVMFITPLTLSFENGQLHMINSIEFPECPVNTLGIYEVRGVPGKYMIFDLVEDPCQGSRGLKGKWTEISQQ